MRHLNNGTDHRHSKSCCDQSSPARRTINTEMTPWPRFKIKMLSYQYRKSHCGDKTVVRSSYLHNGISYTGKMSSLYWIGALSEHINASSLQWRHSGCDSVSKHQPHDCLLNRLFRRRSKKTSKLRVTGLCAGNSPMVGEFPAQMASNMENVSIWWRHHVKAVHTSLYSLHDMISP